MFPVRCSRISGDMTEVRNYLSITFSRSKKNAQASLWRNTGCNIWNFHGYLGAIGSIYLYFQTLRKFCDTLKIAAASSFPPVGGL